MHPCMCPLVSDHMHSTSSSENLGKGCYCSSNTKSSICVEGCGVHKHAMCTHQTGWKVLEVVPSFPVYCQTAEVG